MTDDFEQFADQVRKELVPKVKGSDIFVALTPASPDKVDVKFALEIGLAIMFDKPIVATISPGAVVPEKLARVVDRFVELDLADPTCKDRLMVALNEMLEQLPEKDNGRKEK